MNLRQIPLELPVESALDRDDLIVSQANALAVGLIDSWPRWPGPVVVLVGPAGSGKSHLARVWCEESGAALVSMADLDATAPPQSVCLAIEDACPDAVPEQALFHILNHVRAEGGHCLITARRRPAGWNVRLPDLASRLRAAQIVELGEPDDALLAAVLVKLFADRQVAVAPSIIAYVVSRMERSLEAAGRLVAAMDRDALSRGGRITRSVAARALEAIAQE